VWTNSIINDTLISMARELGCSWLGAVKVNSESAYEYNNCHNNVLIHKSIYGGEQQLGYYFVDGFGTIQAIKHSVWKINNELIDITPYKDKREYIVFGATDFIDYNIPNCFLHSLAKYKQENKIMYYVYQLVDPRNNKPFYIGKGKGRRATTHLWEIPETRNEYKENKIADIRNSGFEPRIEYIAENIIDEDLAYTIEATLIKKYGRKGYEKNGILTNVCIDNRPPNHKGKTYDEIYGPTRAKEQRELRARLQKERGGYGPKQHSEKTKKLLSELTTGKNNPRYGAKVAGTDIAKKIGIANRGKKHYNRKDVKLLYIDGLNIFLYSNDLYKFCQDNNYSCGTFRKQLSENWPRSKKGKNRGLLIRYASETEISSYVVGGTKQDVTEDTFKGFSL